MLPVVLPFSVSNIQKCHIGEIYILLHRRTMPMFAKAVTLTLDPNRRCNTGSIIMIHSVASESPKGLLPCHKKSVSLDCLQCDFRQKAHWGGGSFQVNEGELTVLEQCCVCQVASYQSCEKQQKTGKILLFRRKFKSRKAFSFRGASPP